MKKFLTFLFLLISIISNAQVSITDDSSQIKITSGSNISRLPKENLRLSVDGDYIFIGSLKYKYTEVTTPSCTSALHLANILDGYIENYSTGGGTVSPLTTKGDLYSYSTTDTRLPVGSQGQFLVVDTAQTTGLSWGTPAGGSGATESGTSLRLGSSTAFNTTKNCIGGISSQGTGINATVWGANSRASQNGITIGNDNYAAGAVGNVIMISQSASNTKTSAANAIILAPAYTKADGHGIIGMGRDINVGGTTPANTANNNGVYIGYQSTHTGSTYAGGILIGPGVNGRDADHPTIIAHSPTTANGLQSSVLIGYQSAITDGFSNAVVIGPNASATLDATFGTSGAGQQVAIGYNSKGASWRATATGAYCWALALSSTAYGFGSYVNVAHGSVYGRGGYNDKGGVLLYNGATNPGTIYVGATAAKWTNPAMPGTEAVDMSTALNAGTVVGKLIGVSGRDADAVPTLTNTRGGHLRVLGGPSTGTALGGEVQLAVTPAGASGNTENSEYVVVTVDASKKMTVSGASASEVFRVTSTATNDDPTVSHYQNRVATTNATLTTIHTTAIPATTTVYIVGYVVARRTGGTSGTAEDGAAYEFRAAYKNVSGTATIIGSPTITVVGESQAAWDLQLNPSSGNVLIQIQGAANNNVTWHLSDLKVMSVSN